MPLRIQDQAQSYHTLEYQCRKHVSFWMLSEVRAEKLIKSAAANAENNNGMDPSKLYIEECYANKGPTMKRIKPRAQGRAYRIEKRMSHITVILNER